MVKKLKKTYDTPNTGWNEERMEREEGLMEDYGLKNKKELYKAQNKLRSFRREARKLIAEEDEEAKQGIIERANDLGLIKETAGLEALLTLNIKDILDRRIQSAVERKGYANSIRHARQLVTHGHIYINGRRVDAPSYLLTQEEEKQLEERLPEIKEDDSEQAEEQESEENTEETDEDDENNDTEQAEEQDEEEDN
jgi:small subunit ribosomal protein S4